MALFKFIRGDAFVRHRMRKLTVICLVMMIAVKAANSECNFPSSLWCSSKEIAKDCNVSEQCRTAMKMDPFAGPVNMTLYYESLCPDCKNFFARQLNQTWYALGTHVLNLTLVPYGNADEKLNKETGTWIFNCQHGKEECIGNVIETCAINILDNISVYFPFISCMESKNIYPDKAAKQCADAMGIDVNPIMTCANGQKGNLLEHEMALRTNALKPSHRYVPWVTINGVHTEKMERMAEEDLLSLICETYKGDPPKICLQHLSMERKSVMDSKRNGIN
ncbi:gamma-interferon-inducible lysosomal thiol reductase-like isoform X2 [Mercenaria mercenaria]|uniref:gamma-interferon-inducible lysosomal thiol reductase-like isoform X2 n=1 Tax=Mercenaria mercenaria TaxID=6596 RepID=UPI00234E38FC|nr:gamma-interferon-inducible lysosomal thiol reductase-like isoform X2 [Mercenaria mercenaria]